MSVLFRKISLVAMVALCGGALGCEGGGASGGGGQAPADKVVAAPGPVGGAAKAPSQERVKLVLWHSYRAEEEEALGQVVATFNGARTDIEIEALKIPHQAFADKITAAIPRNNGPDLFIFAHDRIGDWAESGHIEPVSSWARPELLQSFHEQAVKALVYKKSLYGLPLAFKSVVLFYNKALLEAPPETEVALLESARKLTDPAQKRYGLAYENTQLYFSAPWIHGFGGQVLDEAGELRLNDKGTQAGLAFARELMAVHKVVPEDVDSNLVTNLFNEGRAAMVINGPWFRGEISDKVRWGVAPMPTVTSTGKKAAPYLGSEAVLMSSRSTHKEEAFEVMKYLAGPEAAKIRMEVGGQPVAHKASWEGVTDEALKVFQAQLGDAVVMPNTPKMRLVWSPMDQAIYRIVKNGQEPAAALQEATAAIQAQ
jgi:maltose-binding protein MalE